MRFTIEAENPGRESFEEYRYRILRDDQLEFIQGGGSQPVTLTRAAIAYLKEHIA